MALLATDETALNDPADLVICTLGNKSAFVASQGGDRSPMTDTTSTQSSQPIAACAARPTVRSVAFGAIWITICSATAIISLIGLLMDHDGTDTFLVVLALSIGFGLPVLLDIGYRWKARHNARRPLLTVDSDRITDFRQSDLPILFGDIASCKVLYSGRFGAVGIRLVMKEAFEIQSSLFCIIIGKLILLPWRRGHSTCVPCTALDRPASVLAFGIAEKLKSAGIPVETKSPWYLISETHD